MNSISSVPIRSRCCGGCWERRSHDVCFLLPELSASTCHCRTEEERHQHPAGLCRRANLHHDPITRNTSELLITKSPTNGTKTRRPALLASCDFKASAMEKPPTAPYSMPCNSTLVYKASGDFWVVIWKWLQLEQRTKPVASYFV
jgi:hypothetical protein